MSKLLFLFQVALFVVAGLLLGWQIYVGVYLMLMANNISLKAEEDNSEPPAEGGLK